MDHIIFCIGYEYDYPFLALVFIMLPLRAVAFPFAETQSAAVARVWSGRLSLPSRQDMLTWIEENTAKRGPGKSFHKLSHLADADYMNEMCQWCREARCEDDNRLAPPFWGE